MSTEVSRSFSAATDSAAQTPISSAKVDTDFNTCITALNRKVQVKATAPSGPADGDTWVDIGQDPPVLKIYDATNTAWVSASQDMADISTNPGTDEDLADALENFIDGCHIYRVDGDNVGVSVGTAMINGKLRRLSSAIVDVTYTPPDNADWLDIWILADAGATTFTASAVDSGTSPGGSSNPGTNGRMIGSVQYVNSTIKLGPMIQFRDGYITGWDYKIGGAALTLSDTVVFGKTFDAAPIVQAHMIGRQATSTNPTTIGACQTPLTTDSISSGAHTISTTGFTFWSICDANGTEADSTHGSSDNFFYTWTAHGRYS